MNRRPRRAHLPEPVLEYFFEGGDPTKPREELVRRSELWEVLHWYQRSVDRQRGFKAWLWRAIRRIPSSKLNPFNLVALHRKAAEAKEVSRGE
jgi:hypothetical protein